VSGHDFSPAENVARNERGLQPLRALIPLPSAIFNSLVIAKCRVPEVRSRDALNPKPPREAVNLNEALYSGFESLR
jgi:hypothetical protein